MVAIELQRRRSEGASSLNPDELKRLQLFIQKKGERAGMQGRCSVDGIDMSRLQLRDVDDNNNTIVVVDDKKNVKQEQRNGAAEVRKPEAGVVPKKVTDEGKPKPKPKPKADVCICDMAGSSSGARLQSAAEAGPSRPSAPATGGEKFETMSPPLTSLQVLNRRLDVASVRMGRHNQEVQAFGVICEKVYDIHDMIASLREDDELEPDALSTPNPAPSSLADADDGAVPSTSSGIREQPPRPPAPLTIQEEPMHPILAPIARYARPLPFDEVGCKALTELIKARGEMIAEMPVLPPNRTNEQREQWYLRMLDHAAVLASYRNQLMHYYNME